MLGQNVKVKKQKIEDYNGTVLVKEVFDTIQGEGPFTGVPAVFVRFSDCNLACSMCLSGATKIQMKKGKLRIKDVKLGDEVLAYDEEEKKLALSKVTKVFEHEVDEVLKIEITGESLFATKEHPFYVTGRGWVDAGDLKSGDVLFQLTPSEVMKFANPMKKDEVVAKMKATSESRGNSAKVSEKLKRFWSSDKGVAERVKQSARMTASNPMKNPATAAKGFLSRKDRGKMSGVETWVQEVISTNNLPVKFVGDGSLEINFKFPDFVVEGAKKVVEVWHGEVTQKLGRDSVWIENRKRHFASEGYECLFLVLNPHDFYDGKYGSGMGGMREHIKEKLVEFIHNGKVVKSVSTITKSDKKVWARLAGTSENPLKVYNLEVEKFHNYFANGVLSHNCDTDFTGGEKYSTWDLKMEVEAVQRKSNLQRKLVVITGGEPFLQYGMYLFARMLINSGHTVQIETAGTVVHEEHLPAIELDQRLNDLHIVCSPKTGSISKALQPFIGTYKYILDADAVSSVDGLPNKSYENGKNLHIYRPEEVAQFVRANNVVVIPVDTGDAESNRNNLTAAISSCMKYGYRLGTQMHKNIGMP